MNLFHAVQKAVRVVFLLPVYIYRYLLSPLIPGRCIYSPSCSLYAQQAVMKHGVFKGFFLSVMRVFRCHSMFTGGEDPVPDSVSWSRIREDYRTFRDRD